MREIGIARGALLLAVRAHGVDVGAVEQVFVGGGVILFDPIDQLELPHHPRLAALRRRYVVLRHEVGRARDRDPQPGLVLHPRQINRRARHQDLGLRRETRPAKAIIKISWRGLCATRRPPPSRSSNQSCRPVANFPLPHCTLPRLRLADQRAAATAVSIRTPSGRNASWIAQATAGGVTMRPLPLKALT